MDGKKIKRIKKIIPGNGKIIDYAGIASLAVAKFSLLGVCLAVAWVLWSAGTLIVNALAIVVLAIGVWLFLSGQKSTFSLVREIKRKGR